MGNMVVGVRLWEGESVADDSEKWERDWFNSMV